LPQPSARNPGVRDERLLREIPNPKFQIPNKFQNLKAQFPTLWRVLGFGFWRFEASLGFGNWILELPPLAVVEHFVSGSVEDCEEWTIKL
jgi:hypothetical protein